MYQRKNSHASTQTLKQPSETTARHTPSPGCSVYGAVRPAPTAEISSHLPRDAAGAEGSVLHRATVNSPKEPLPWTGTFKPK